jgi:hypothetical protein
MPGTDPFRLFTDRLERANIPYMVTGSVASMVYGEPRLTHDVDIVIELGRGEAARLVSAFEEEEFYCPPLEAVAAEAGRRVRGRFNLIHHGTGYKADLYLAGQDPLHRWAMSRRVRIAVGGNPLWLAPPEYVILRKLEYYREGGSQKHLRDIAAMLDVSGDRIDQEEIAARARDLGLEGQWAAAKKLSGG